MNDKVEDKPKERGHRPKKFGDHESIVASWRVDKDAYKESKTEIRKDVNNVLESYSGNKKMVKKEIPDVVNKPTNNVEDINKLVKTEKKNKEKIFIIDQEDYDRRDYAKEFLELTKEEQPERVFMDDVLFQIHNNRDEVNKEDKDNENTVKQKQIKEDKKKSNNYFDRFKDNNGENIEQIKDLVQEDKKKIDEQDTEDFRDDEEITEEMYEEFKDFIDPNDERIKRFVDSHEEK